MMDRVYRGIRHRDAQLIADGVTENTDLASLTDHEYCLVATYREEGTAVPTPVWFAVAAGELYFRTAEDALKIGRLRARPIVRLASCDARGRPLEKPPRLISGVARVLDGHEGEAAETLLQEKYGRKRTIYTGCLEGHAYVVVSPVKASA